MKDLRSFLDVLGAADRLVRIAAPVDPLSEAARLMRALEKVGKAGLFTTVRGSGAALVYNLVGSREAMALALDTTPGRVTRAFIESCKRRVEPILISEGPVQEVVNEGEGADLRSLPLVVHSEKDAGPYLTAGMVIARDPETGLRNVSVNRMMVVNGQEAGIRMMPPQQLGVIQAKAEALGQDLPLIVAIGVHPADMIAAGTTLPLGDDELAVAGALRGEPVSLVKAVSVDLEVPAHAEIVLEGVVRAGVREPEGPFGDFLQYYVPEMKNHRFRLTAMTHRRDPIFQTMQAGSPEDVGLLGISREAQVLAAVESIGAEVAGICLGPTILGCTIGIRKRCVDEAKNVAMAAFEAYRWLKYCIVVDHDVNVFDIADVWWAVTTRSNPSQAIHVMTDADGFPRDPFDLHTGKAMVDATIPLGEWKEFERKRPPGDGDICLEDFVS